jgi:FkbM family methyltransferase
MKKLPVGVKFNRYHWLYFKNDPYVNGVCADANFIFEEFMYHNIQKYKVQTEGTTIVDIVANMGSHTLNFAQLVGDNGKVYAFEPSRLVYYQLCGNVFANGFPNVYCENIALGDTNEIDSISVEDLDYFNDSVNSGNTHVGVFGKHIVSVKNLDDYQLDNVSLIKIDVQGYEPYVLDGAKQTILKNKPTIFIEIEPEHLEMFGFNEWDVINRLHDLGYQVIHDHKFDYVAIPLENT